MKSLKFPDENKELDAFNERLMGAEEKVAAAVTTTNTESWSPEELYQQLRARWYFHPYSWFMLQYTIDLRPEEYKMTCNGVTGCIKECRFYEPEGRIEPAELQRMIESLEKFIAWKKAPCNAATCKMHPNHKVEDNNNNGCC